MAVYTWRQQLAFSATIHQTINKLTRDGFHYRRSLLNLKCRKLEKQEGTSQLQDYSEERDEEGVSQEEFCVEPC